MNSKSPIASIPNYPLKVLVVGGGGREHALCWKLAQSELVESIYCAPGNGGTFGEHKTSNVAISTNSADFPKIAEFALEKKIDLVVIGPDNPLAEGIVDFLQSKNLRVFGPPKMAARLEWSKSYAKAFMTEWKVPTARYVVCHSLQEAETQAKMHAWATVVKVDGLALGKGVFVCASQNEVLSALNEIYNQDRFGKAGETVILEEKLVGEELSLLYLCDGKTLVPLASSQDYKRRFDNQEGPNTGGMGAYSPVALYEQYAQAIDKSIVSPLTKAIAAHTPAYQGILYAGVMIGAIEPGGEKSPYVLEFNARFGDPETQAILPRLTSDLLPALWSCTEGSLSQINLTWDKRPSCCVVAVTKEYPEKSSKDENIELAPTQENSVIFHAATKKIDQKLQTAGGRIFSVTSLASDLNAASKASYAVLEKCHFDSIDFRTDIAREKMRCL